MLRLETIVLFLLLAGCGPIDSDPDRLAKESVRRLTQIEGFRSPSPPSSGPWRSFGTAGALPTSTPTPFMTCSSRKATLPLKTACIRSRSGAAPELGNLRRCSAQSTSLATGSHALVRYRGDMEAEWASYSPQAREIAQAFTSGINAYVEQNRDRLPIEFDLLGFAPGPGNRNMCCCGSRAC